LLIPLARLTFLLRGIVAAIIGFGALALASFLVLVRFAGSRIGFAAVAFLGTCFARLAAGSFIVAGLVAGFAGAGFLGGISAFVGRVAGALSA
jgi:hypothetical protein